MAPDNMQVAAGAKADGDRLIRRRRAQPAAGLQRQLAETVRQPQRLAPVGPALNAVRLTGKILHPVQTLLKTADGKFPQPQTGAGIFPRQRHLVPEALRHLAGGHRRLLPGEPATQQRRSARRTHRRQRRDSQRAIFGHQRRQLRRQHLVQQLFLLGAQAGAAGDGLAKVRPTLAQQRDHPQAQKVAVIGIVLITLIFNPRQLMGERPLA